MSDFVEQTVELSTGQVQYLIGGTGPALLHLHSASGPRLSPAIERLATKHTIYVPTLPGFNGTTMHAQIGTMDGLAGVAAEFIRKAIGKGCDVMAESFGGWVALWLAVKHPDLVEQLVLEAAAGMRSRDLAPLPTDPADSERLFHAVPERAPRNPRYAEALPGNIRVAMSYTGGQSLDDALVASLQRIRARTLLLFGTKDEVAPAGDVGRRLKAGIANSHLSYIYGAAHALEFDQPDRVARLVGAFLERGEAFVVRTAEVA
ncbi:MAG TPA: alpha/beta hydrolase [Xanthobacteraceae bacterium]